jgi:hypothetical protein
MRFLLLVLILLATARPATAAPENKPRHGLSLDEGVRIALENNPELAALRSEAKAPGTGWHRSDNPVIVFSDKLTSGEFTARDFALDRLNNPNSLNHGTVGIGLVVPIDVSGRVGSAITAAPSEKEVAWAHLRAAESDLVVRVTEAYFGLSLAGAAAKVAESTLASALSQEATAQDRFNAGSALKSDVLRTRVERLARERDLERREADHKVARARMRHLLGVEPKVQVRDDWFFTSWLVESRENTLRARGNNGEITSPRNAGPGEDRSVENELLSGFSQIFDGEH